MHLRLKRYVAVLALYALALHVILPGLASFAANGSLALDPFSAICHVPTIAGDEVPAEPGLVPGYACDHCNLCSTAGPPQPSAAATLARLAPARILHVLHPASAAVRTYVAADPNRVRGPPPFA